MSRTYRYKKHSIMRGAYRGTTDNRLDRWYIAQDRAHGASAPDYLDRRGPGFATIAEAKTEIDMRVLLGSAS